MSSSELAIVVCRKCKKQQMPDGSWNKMDNENYQTLVELDAHGSIDLIYDRCPDCQTEKTSLFKMANDFANGKGYSGW